MSDAPATFGQLADPFVGAGYQLSLRSSDNNNQRNGKFASLVTPRRKMRGGPVRIQTSVGSPKTTVPFAQAINGGPQNAESEKWTTACSD